MYKTKISIQQICWEANCLVCFFTPHSGFVVLRRFLRTLWSENEKKNPPTLAPRGVQILNFPNQTLKIKFKKQRIRTKQFPIKPWKYNSKNIEIIKKQVALEYFNVIMAAVEGNLISNKNWTPFIWIKSIFPVGNRIRFRLRMQNRLLM